MPMGWQADADILLRLVIAMALGGVIGWDREHRGRSAGIRTNMLVALSAALFTSTADLLISRYSLLYPEFVKSDPVRVLQAIVIGISFLGSGIIFVSRDRSGVRGLTTAASVWTITGVGIVVGLGHFLLGAGVTLIVFFVLEVVRKIELMSGVKPAEDRESSP